jgi:hypothetical protein
VAVGKAGKNDTPKLFGCVIDLMPGLPGRRGPLFHVHPSAERQPAQARMLGKEWIPIAYKRRAEELRPDLMNITTASKRLATESATAADCAKPLTAS